PLDDNFKRVTKLSFPTKMSTYVAAQVPILYHGPQDSSVTRFFEKYPIGLPCYSNRTDEIISQLDALVSDHALRSSINLALVRAYEEEMSPFQFRRRVEKLVGVRGKDLNT